MLQFGYIHEHEKDWSIRLQCQVPGVSESGYYRHKSSIGKPRRDEVITVEINVFVYYNRLRIYTKNSGGLPLTVYREKTITEAA